MDLGDTEWELLLGWRSLYTATYSKTENGLGTFVLYSYTSPLLARLRFLQV
jgi:hypothetical protein